MFFLLMCVYYLSHKDKFIYLTNINLASNYDLISGDTVMKKGVMVSAFMELMFMGEVNIEQLHIINFRK